MLLIRSTTLAAVLAGAMAVQGCQEINLADGAVSASDNCSQYRAVISEARRTEINQQAQAAAGGAILGALLGAAVSGSDDRARGAIVGAVAGGLTGFAATYAQQAAARAEDSRQLLAVINNDAGREGALVTRTGQAAASLRSCRRSQIESLTQRVRGGQITPAAARSELQSIQTSVRGDNQVISAAFQGIGQRVNAYVDTTNQVVQVDQAISSAGARRAAPSVARVSQQANATLQTDKSSQNRVDAELDALEALIG